jgi:hypothetical protein
MECYTIHLAVIPADKDARHVFVVYLRECKFLLEKLFSIVLILFSTLYYCRID